MADFSSGGQNLRTSDPQLQKWARDVDVTLQENNRTLALLANRSANIDVAVVAMVADVDVPPDPVSCSASTTGYIRDGLLYERVTINYTSPTPLRNFAGIFIVAGGYNGASASTLVKVGEDTFHGASGAAVSFSNLVLQKTGETITLYFVAKNSLEGARHDWQNAPHVSLALTAGLGVINSTLQTKGNSPTNIGATVVGASPLSNDGASTTISVASFSVQYGFGTLSYNSGSIDPGSFGKYGVYFDDPLYSGGVVVFHADTSASILTATDTRVVVGYITTVNGVGHVGTGGGNGGGGNNKLNLT
jgi:hypothetical protein